MLTIAGILIIAFIIAAIDVPPLLQQKLKRELWLFFTILLVGLSISSALALNIDIPSPLNLISNIYNPISQVVENYFK